MVLSRAWATVFMAAFAAIGGRDGGDAGQAPQSQGQEGKGQTLTSPALTTATIPTTDSPPPGRESASTRGR
jgi:hypothetical protein